MDQQALWLRLGHQDHLTLNDAMAPRLGARSVAARMVGGVVLEAQVPLASERIVEAVRDVGLPLVVDPYTPALQYDGLGSSKAWRGLPYARDGKVTPEDLQTDSARQQFTDEVLAHQLALGPSQLVAPYFYVMNDSWWGLNLALLREARAWMQRVGVGLPLAASLAGPATRIGAPSRLSGPVADFARAAVVENVATVHAMLSPLGQGDESYDKLLGVVEVVGLLRAHGLRVQLARAGRYGPAFAAAGASAFDAGIGSGDSLNVASTARARAKPPSKKRRSGGSSRVYLQALGTSLPVAQLSRLFEAGALPRAVFGCDETECCPDTSVMVNDWKGHTVRARARATAEVAAVPREGRLGFAAQQQEVRIAAIAQANTWLKSQGFHPVKDRGPRELRQVLRHLHHQRGSTGDVA